MKYKTLLAGVSLASACALSNCSSSTIVDERLHESGVKLSQANFKVVATQVKGVSSGFHLLSAVPTSIPTSLADAKGFVNGADGGIAISSATKAEALQNLYKNAGNQHNRSTAFVNIREEKTGKNWLLFSRPQYIITADLIEFVK